jgi:hypothetical protein
MLRWFGSIGGRGGAAECRDSSQSGQGAVGEEAVGRVFVTFGRRRVSRETQLIGFVSTLVAVLVAILSVVLPPVQPDQVRALPIIVVVLLVIAAITFLLFVPRATRFNRPAVPGLVCSILGLLLLPVFWSGLPIVLGTAGALLGRVAGTTQRGLALAAIIVGIGAVVLNLLGLLGDRLF